MRTYNLGIIGAGMWGKVLARCFQQDPRARILWVNSAGEATSKAAAHELGSRWTTDYREILADPTVDAVAIATPPYLHAQQLLDALAAGKHVLIEKPLAESPERVASIVRAVEQSPHLIVLEASARFTRLTPKYRLIKSLIQGGKLGQIYHIHHVYLMRRTFIEHNPNAIWAMNRKLSGGGPFIDWGPYDFSFHLGLLDDTPELLAVRSFTRNDLRDVSDLVAYSDIEQHGAAWLEFSGGLTYYYERGAGVHGETLNETRIQGTKGGLRFQFAPWDSNQIEFFFCEHGKPCRETLTVEDTDALDPTLALTRHFLDCLDGQAEPLMPVSLAAKHIGIVFRILGKVRPV